MKLKQYIILLLDNDSIQMARQVDRGDPQELIVTDELKSLTLSLDASASLQKDPLEEKIDRLTDYLEQTGDDEVLVSFMDIWPSWESQIGQPGTSGRLMTKSGILYRIYQPLPIIFEHQPPEHLPAHYEAINKPSAPGEPVEYEDWIPGAWAEGSIVWHNGRLWENRVVGKANTWEPGAIGVHENIWKDITEA